MKKSILLALFLPLVVSCTPSTISSTLTTDTTTTTSEVEEFKSHWGVKEVEEAIEASIKFDIPYFYAPKYVANATVDAFNDPTLELYFLGFEEDETIVKAEAYANVCKASGYEVDFKTNNYEGIEYDVYFATTKMNDEFEIQLQIVHGQTGNNEYGVAVNATICVIVDGTSFPSNLIKHYFDYSIPVLEKEYFAYYGEVGIQDNTIVGYIELQNARQSDEDEYYNLVKDAGYQIDDTYYYDYGYICLSSDNGHYLQFMYIDNLIMIYTFKNVAM